MFKLNKEIATKTGEVLKPFLVEGETVYSFDRQGNTIMKKLDDFSFKDEIIGNAMKIVSIKKSRKEPLVSHEPVVELNNPIVEVEEPLIPSIKKIEIEEKIETPKKKRKKVVEQEKQVIKPITNKSYSNVEPGKAISNDEYV